jgi:hypothetical protein
MMRRIVSGRRDAASGKAEGLWRIAAVRWRAASGLRQVCSVPWFAVMGGWNDQGYGIRAVWRAVARGG